MIRIKTQTLLIIIVCLISISTNVSADTWCNSAYPPDPPACHCAAIYCNDLDRICNGAPACPPPPPMPCPYPCGQDLCWSWAQIRAAFPRTSRINDTGNLCGIEFKGEEDQKLLTSAPFGTRDPYGDIGQATVNLIGDIQYTYGAQYNAVMGTDANPLVLRFNMCTGIAPKTGPNVHGEWDIGVMELFLDTGTPNANRVPMDYMLVGVEEDPILNPGCISCYNMCPSPNYGPHSPWPHVCQSYSARTESSTCAGNPCGPPYCPPLETNIRTAIAVGCNALLDHNPCHCDISTNQKPTNPYLSYYDGLKWRILHPDHPGPGGETLEYTSTHPSIGYFVLGAKSNAVTMTIKSYTVEIEHTTRLQSTPGGEYDTWVTSTVTGIKRQYIGAFNKLHAGASIGCQMDSNGVCVGNRHCLHSGYDRCDYMGKTYWGAKWLVFDGVAVFGGVPGDEATGACCYGNGECAIMTMGECEDAPPAGLGGRYDGHGSQCGDLLCCPTPFADDDRDGDVDQDDFAKFQACFTGPGPATVGTDCWCFDRDNSGQGDQDIDTDDFAAFEACASGPSVPANPACEN
ncbi:MAG: hypothetical protein JSV03_00635 [Planctomycetota bacterium]|nr:MAG: hypothetical protein JSV03_00635 [Planctomycetota bacterium]